MITILLSLFKIPLIRHIMAAVAIIFAIQQLAIKPLEKENKKLHYQLKEQRHDFIQLTQKALDKAGNQINNNFDKIKQGKKAEPIVLKLDNEAVLHELEIEELQLDTLHSNIKPKKKGFFKRLFRK